MNKNNKLNDELILFGNGIGMAINSELFSLKKAVKESTSKLTEEEIEMIQNISGEQEFYDVDDIESSHGLAYINLISIIGNRFLNGPKSKNNLYLSTNDLKKLVHTINKFIYSIAEHFNNIDTTNSEDLKYFYDELSKYIDLAKINSKKIHIATTNYDDLFYKYLLDNKYMKPKAEETFFTDGFNKSKKKGSNLKFNPKNSPNCSWYMHLHGSDLVLVFRTLN